MQTAGHEQDFGRDAAGHGIVSGLDILHGQNSGGVDVFGRRRFDRLVGGGAAARQQQDGAEYGRCREFHG